MITLGSTVIGVQDVARATAFWSAALGWEPTSAGDDTWIILQSFGATEVDWDLYPADADFVVLADTEGNRFCVIDSPDWFSHGT